MSGTLRALGVAVGVGGGLVAAVCAWLFFTDTQYFETVEAYARHPTHAVFQVEYWVATLRHWGIFALGVTGAVGGVVFGALLLGVGAVLRRQRR